MHCIHTLPVRRTEYTFFNKKHQQDSTPFRIPAGWKRGGVDPDTRGIPAGDRGVSVTAITIRKTFNVDVVGRARTVDFWVIQWNRYTYETTICLWGVCFDCDHVDFCKRVCLTGRLVCLFVCACWPFGSWNLELKEGWIYILMILDVDFAEISQGIAINALVERNREKE